MIKSSLNTKSAALVDKPNYTFYTLKIQNLSKRLKRWKPNKIKTSISRQ